MSNVLATTHALSLSQRERGKTYETSLSGPRRPLALGATVVLILLAAGCAPADAPAGGAPGAAKQEAFVAAGYVGAGEEPKRGGILTAGQKAELPGTDPHFTSTIHLTHVSAPVTGDGNLFKPCRDDVDKLCPGVAERWEASADASQYTVKVRDDIRWHDSTPFSAEDVKFWLDLAYSGAKVGDKTRRPARYKPRMGDIKEVEVLSGNRVRVSLDGPDTLWPARMANAGGGSMGGGTWHPKHLMQPLIERGEVNVSPQDVGFVGIGPYKWEKYDKGTLIQLRRFDGYWEKDEKGRQLPFLDGIDYAILPDPGAEDAAFRTGRLDVGAYGPAWPTAERVDALRNALGDRVWFTQFQGPLFTLSFNSARPGPLQDPRVRRAISLWVDRQAYTLAIQGGPCCGDIHPGMGPRSMWTDPNWRNWPGFNPATKEQDRAEARRLLAEAGYASGFDMPIQSRRAVTDRSEWAVGELAPLGVRLKISIVEEPDWVRVEQAGEFHIAVGDAWSFSPAIGPEEVAGLLQRHSVNPLTRFKHEDAKVEQYFARIAAAAGDLDQRVKVWRELERYLVLEQALAAPTMMQLIAIPHRSYVKGVYVPAHSWGNNLDRATTWLQR